MVPGASKRHLERIWVMAIAVVFGALGSSHAVVDQVDDSNVKQNPAGDRNSRLVPMHRALTVKERFVLFPVQEDVPVRRVRVSAGERIVREFDIKLALTKPHYEVFLDAQSFQGQTLKLETDLPQGSNSLDQVRLSADVPDAGGLYRESRRPQFHFTSQRGWLNDPNGLVWFDGEYHLFYQHNPYGWDWGNMHWGHAVSSDLVRWSELPIALYPKTYGDWCFSGSAVVDRRNTSGFGTDGSPPLVLAYTSTGRGECIAFSRDRGCTWTEYATNPVVKHTGRDPRLLWHEPTKRWVMAVYDETGGARSIAFHSSPDLKNWRFESRIDGFFECPELFELPVAGNAGTRLWVLHAADGAYQLGQFDGRRFEPTTPKARVWYGNFYASQTFSDTPDHRRIQIGWANGITFPGEPFNQQMTVACELTLRPTADGPRLFARPAAELASLRQSEHILYGFTLAAGERKLEGLVGRLLDIDIEAEVGEKGAFEVGVRGTMVAYDGVKKVLTCGKVSAPLAPERTTVRLRILLDRGSIEVFGNDGRVAVSAPRDTSADKPHVSIAVPATSPPVKIRSIHVFELASAWS
jgi:fructan beta-fructosidase